MDFPTRLVVELGMGDGILLEILALQNQNSVFIGIEINLDQCIQARSRISLLNISIINSSFEDIVPILLNESIDEFITALPDPDFIDQKCEDQWKDLYKCLYSKLKKNGRLKIITELTDELLQPVSDDRYFAWTEWLKSCFVSLGFSVVSLQEGAPSHYSSHCIDQFRGDPKRIRMLTLDLLRP